MKTIYFFLALFITLDLSAQEELGDLLIIGQIRDLEGGKIRHAQVRVENERGEFYTVMAGNNDSVKVHVDFDREVKLIFSAKDHEPKTLIVNTNGVPAEEKVFGYEFVGFTVDLKESKSPSDGKVVGRIYYDPDVQNFVPAK